MYEENQDTTVTVLGFENVDGDAINLLSFFLVHGTSLYENNTLVSGDNKGMAAWMYKSEFPATTPMLQGSFNAISPQISTANHPENHGLPNPASLSVRHAVIKPRTVTDGGPGFHISDFESNRIIGQAQFKATQTVVENSNMTTLKDDFIHLRYPMGHLQKHAPLLLVTLSQVEPHKPMSLDHDLSANLYTRVTYYPGELTTMAGRRMRDVLKARLIAEGVLDDRAYVVIVDPENTYGHYITTHEEYGVQRYDGASTIFGPATLDAYINKYSELVPYLAMNATWIPSSNAAPPELTSKAISLQTLVVVDNPPIFKHFGDVLIDVESGIYHARDTVAVWFVGANPWNNLRLDGMFLTVDRQLGYHPSPAEELMITKLVLYFLNSQSSWTTHQTKIGSLLGIPMDTYDSQQQQTISLSIWEQHEPESQMAYPWPIYVNCIGKSSMRSSLASSISSLCSSSVTTHPYHTSSVMKIVQPLRHVNITVDDSQSPPSSRPYLQMLTPPEMISSPPLHTSPSESLHPFDGKTNVLELMQWSPECAWVLLGKQNEVHMNF
ncbi:Neutral/alkaline non-lysosomal ceramidase-domain-containing protein [Suillus cothurnatus]|nr:Neutral/alkaline non-lysosomal ceramidase-domain-containing protein [Suillus cothurnatus]